MAPVQAVSKSPKLSSDVEAAQTHAAQGQSLSRLQHAVSPTDPRAGDSYARYIDGQVRAMDNSRVASVFPEGTTNYRSSWIDLIELMAEEVRKNAATLTLAELVRQAVDRGFLRKIDSPNDATLCHIIFHVLGWVSCLFSSTLPMDILATTSFQLDKTQLASHLEPSLPLLLAKRPLRELLRSFGPLIPGEVRRDERPGDPLDLAKPEDAILVSNVNAAALTRIGKLQIQWVTCISSHLHLDVKARRLKMFALPSFCQFSKEPTTPLYSILETYFDRRTRPAEFSASGYLEEILFSYALIFRDEEKSRKLYRKHQRLRASEARGGVDEPLLDSMCGLHSTGEIRKSQGVKVLHSVTKADIPILWTRLQELQDFILQEQPWDLQTLWQDRRDLLRWYTLWALLVLGVIGIVLALVQIALSAAQVSLAYRALQLQQTIPAAAE